MEVADDTFSRVAGDRILAMSATRSVALFHSPTIERLGVVARLLNQNTSQPSSETILLDMAPWDAFALAHAILEVVAERGWEFERGATNEWPAHPRAKN